MKSKEVLVSISCITYNHVQYIRQCLDGFLMQQTNFAFEVLIHDDCSTDGTTEIIKEYELMYPDIIKPIYEKENQYQQGKPSGSVVWNFPRAQGKYIAMCEGDDYWIDPLKLQKQVDFLDANPEYSMCFHDVYRIVDNQKADQYRQYESSKDVPIEDIILNGGLFCPTASMIFRLELLGGYPEFANKCHVGDYPLQIYLALAGKVYFCSDIMGCYRIGVPGSWTESMRKAERSVIISKMENEIEMLNNFNTYSNNQYSSIFIQRINIYKLRTYISLRDKVGVKECYPLVRDMKIKDQVLCFLVVNNMSFVIDLYKFVKTLCCTTTT